MITNFVPADQSYEGRIIDLNKLLIKRPTSTVFMQIASAHYVSMGIYNGDILIIDRAKPITPNSLVVYEVEGHFTLGRVFNIHQECIITGTIIHVIHTVKCC